jgi:ABC-2 type transport system permease protein
MPRVRKILVIARREYLAAVQTKMFIISLVILPVLMGGSAVVQMLLESQERTRPKRFAVIDRTPGEQIYAELDRRVQQDWNKNLKNDEGKQVRPEVTLERVMPSADTPEARKQQRYELSERVHRDEFFGFLEIGPDVWPKSRKRPHGDDEGPSPSESSEDRTGLVYQTNNLLADAFPTWAERQINALVHDQRAKLEKLKPELIAYVLRPVPLFRRGLAQRNRQTGAIEEASKDHQVASLVIPVSLAALMFVVVMLGSNPLMQGVVEEKMQRIAEVLLGSVEPFQLMMGKLIGMAGVSLTVAAVYLGGVYWAVFEYKLTQFMPASLVAWFIVYLVLAVLMYGSLFIAVGAACTDMKETQTLLMPVVFIVCLPLLAMGPVVREPNSAFALAFSFVPFATPMLMVARMAAAPELPWWQPVLGVVLVLGTTLVCVYAAGRIFRVGLLMQGKGARMSDLVRWVVRG